MINFKDGDGYIFVVSPGSSGSTLLRSILQAVPNTCSLPAEGQAFAWPYLYGVKSYKGIDWIDKKDAYINIDNYNWDEVKKIWHSKWVCKTPNNNPHYFIEKSCVNIYRTQMMSMVFPNSRFAIMIRDPYITAIEMVVRRFAYGDPNRSYNFCGRFWLKMAEAQIENIETLADCSSFFTYEDLYDNKDIVYEKIKKILPTFTRDILNKEFQLHKVANNSRASLKVSSNKIANYNKKLQLYLTPGDLYILNEHFSKRIDLLSYFGYKLKEIEDFYE